MTDIFYVTVIPSLFFSAFMAGRLYGLRRHDIVLFRFCEIRRELMTFLREEGKDLSREDYEASRRLVDALEHTIHNYNAHKTSLFNGRRFLRWLRDYQQSAKQAAGVPKSAHEKVNDLNRQLGHALFSAFLAYTPLFRSEILLRLFIAATAILAKLGVRYMAQTSVQIRTTFTILKEQAEASGVPYRYAR